MNILRTGRDLALCQVRSCSELHPAQSTVSMVPLCQPDVVMLFLKREVLKAFRVLSIMVFCPSYKASYIIL